METTRYRALAQSFGTRALLSYLLTQAVNRMFFLKVLKGMILTKETLNSRYAVDPVEYDCRFLTPSELLECSKDPNLDLPPEFVREAGGRGDRCFGIFSGGALVSYGWYTNNPTEAFEGLTIVFDPSYVYMYRGYTVTNYRGKQLHALGMALALKEYAKEGFAGLISYVESTNFASLRSVSRMGYRIIGNLVAVRIFGKMLTFRTGKSAKYSFELAPRFRFPGDEGAAEPAFSKIA